MIFLTGSTGFVGSAVLKYFSTECILQYKKGDILNIDQSSTVIHLAGKAHDLKNTSSPHEYYQNNTELTKNIFDAFLASEANVFIALSSVKAVADDIKDELTEEYIPNPMTHYGKSKLLAEQYIFQRIIPEGKRVYVLRPCMIHGPGNKGNLNLLFKLASKNIPWPLGAFENKRSFCSIDNLMFIFKELIKQDNIPSGIYNVSDDEPVSTNELIELIAESQNKKICICKISKYFIEKLAFFGDKLHLPLNTERLGKLTKSYVVSNKKIRTSIGKPLPILCKEGLLNTFKSF